MPFQNSDVAPCAVAKPSLRARAHGRTRIRINRPRSHHIQISMDGGGSPEDWCLFWISTIKNVGIRALTIERQIWSITVIRNLRKPHDFIRFPT